MIFVVIEILKMNVGMNVSVNLKKIFIIKREKYVWDCVWEEKCENWNFY